MTVIAYRAGIIAADSRAYAGDKVPIGSKQKIRRLGDGTLLGASSTHVGGTGWAMDWYEDGMPSEAGKEVKLPDSFTLLVVKPDGSVWYADKGGDKGVANLTGPLSTEFIAIGSGEEYALGAMAAGLDAISAVKAVCKLDVWSDLPIYAASLAGPMPKLNVGLPPDQFVWVNEEKKR
jgi:ATP-dependent protease HslVU (ClpYQ) peptidase subunit